MKLRQFFPLLFVALLGHATIAAGQPAAQSIILASTTSVENSGLLAHILPAFTKETGITVHVLAQGTRRHFRRRLATFARAGLSRRRTSLYPPRQQPGCGRAPWNSTNSKNSSARG